MMEVFQAHKGFYGNLPYFQILGCHSVISMLVERIMSTYAVLTMKLIIDLTAPINKTGAKAVKLQVFS